MKTSILSAAILGALLAGTTVYAAEPVTDPLSTPQTNATEAGRDAVDKQQKEVEKARKEANKDADKAAKKQKKSLKNEQKAAEEQLEKKNELERDKLDKQPAPY